MKSHQFKTSIAWVITENFVTIIAAFILIASASIAFFVGSLAETLVATPFAESLIQRRGLTASVIDTAHTSMTVVGLAVSATLCLLGPFFAWIYSEPKLFPLIAVQGCTCMLLGLRGAPEAILSKKLRFKALSIRNITAKCAGAILCIALALAGAGAWSLILGNVAFAFVATCMIWVVTRRKPKFRWRMGEAKALLSFGLFSLVDGLLWTATPRLFGFLASYFHGVSAAALLNIAFRINDTVCAIISAVSTRIAFPLFSRMAHDRQRLCDTFEKGSRITFIIAAPAFAGLALVGKEIIALTLGSQWAAAAPALGVVCFYSLFNFARLLAQPAIKALGRPALLLWLHGVGLGYIAIGCVLTAPFDLNAQLMVWAMFGFVYYLTSAILLERASGLGLLKQSLPLVPGTIAGVGMTVCLLFLQPYLAAWPSFPSLVMKIAAGGLIYLGLVLVLERRAAMTLVGPYLHRLADKPYRP
jgi:O-antigen/teichoic acid export membrane protein